jgi:hypothetical protein
VFLLVSLMDSEHVSREDRTLIDPIQISLS